MKKFDNVKLLDCTLRDGGIVNDSRFSDDTVRAIYDACADSNIGYIEFGYKNSDKILSRDYFGKWRFCDDSDIKKIIGDNKRDIKISVLSDADKCDIKSFAKKSDSPVDLVRYAFYANQRDAALDAVKAAHDKGYETALCMMAVSTLDEKVIEESLSIFAESEATMIYLMDSFGTFLPHETRGLISKYRQTCSASKKILGMHAHDNLELAFSNSIDAIINGADIIDCSLAGLGKGAGNCRTELIYGFLNGYKSLLPILKVIETHIEPMREKYRWGLAPQYMATSFLNINPKPAMQYERGTTHKSIIEFFDEVSAGEII